MDEDPGELFGPGVLPDEANFFIDAFTDDTGLQWLQSSFVADRPPSADGACLEQASHCDAELVKDPSEDSSPIFATDKQGDAPELPVNADAFTPAQSPEPVDAVRKDADDPTLVALVSTEVQELMDIQVPSIPQELSVVRLSPIPDDIVANEVMASPRPHPRLATSPSPVDSSRESVQEEKPLSSAQDVRLDLRRTEIAAVTPAASESTISTRPNALRKIHAVGEVVSYTEVSSRTPQATPLSPSPSRSRSTASATPSLLRGPVQPNVSVELPAATLVSPPSYYEPFEPPAPELAEWRVVEILLRESRRLRLDQGDYTEFDLNNFAVYVDSVHYPNEMRSLHFLDTRQGHSKYYFDGCLSVGDVRYFVRRVPIAALPIDGYTDPEIATARGLTWLQSMHNARNTIYYKLGKPAREYARFFEPFVWVADLAKHFVDYLDAMMEDGIKVSIHCFISAFGQWLLQRHGGAPELLEWGQKHLSGDFRSSIVAHVGFLHKEAYGVLGPKRAHFHPLWNEIMRFERFKPEPALGPPHNPTIVTEYIRQLFSALPFGDRLECIPLSPETKRLRQRIIRKRRVEAPKDLVTSNIGLSRKVKAGDTISTFRDDAGSGSKWKQQSSHGVPLAERWFAHVLKVSKIRRRERDGSRGSSADGTRRRQRVFDVIWYYRPEDTLCGSMKYPWPNELFLSDHCSCTESSKITEDQVMDVHDVDFWGTPTTKKDFFCRQTYVSGDRTWITLKGKHLQCEHINPDHAIIDEPRYRIGETVLVHLDKNSDRTEPCEIAELEEGSAHVGLRQLRRRRNIDDSSAPVNELVWSSNFVHTKRSRIQTRCHVRFFPHGMTIPAPYDRSGVGAFFFITHEQNGETCAPLTELPATLRQGFDPYQDIPKLRGLDLFCGGGNFGRGLEDGGAIEMRWLNDYDQHAVHTYMANVADPNIVHPFLGSIDELQRQAIRGNFSEKVPKIGEVDFISAGSPCPGFSNLTNDKTTPQQRKNQSLVAAFGSFVDLYRPQYALLENVRGIVQKKANRDQDVFSQLICAVVGLGYQTRFFFLDASSCGSPQSRGRVFLVIAAPGCRLPNTPQITHSHPPTARALSLGLLPNGEPMAEREMPDATPFKFVSAAESCDDLPKLYDAKPDTCILHPDHRVMIGTTKDMRVQTCLIPTQPWGMNFAKAWYGMEKKCAGSGVLTQADRDSFPADAGTRTLGRTLANSSAFGRLMPNRPFITITTRQSPGDAKNGTQLHWQEPRPITLMEARRAQGFRDHEVLLGSVSQQYRIVGNSVAREVAVALGLMFREAEYGSLTDGEEDLSRLMEVDTEDLMDTTTDGEEAEDLLSSGETSSRSETVTTNVSMRSTPAMTKRARSTSTLLTVEIPTMKRSRRVSAAPSSDGTTTPSARRSRSSSRRT